MKKIVVAGIVVLALCFAGCGGDGNSGNDAKPAKPNGNAGVSVNSSGDLVINTPLYYIDYDDEGVIDGSYAVKPVNLSLSETVNVLINFNATAVTGTISGGMLSVTIPEPNTSLLIPVIDNPDMPVTFVKTGSGTRTGYLWLNCSLGSIQLIANPPSRNKAYMFTYADGSAAISGANSTTILDFNITKGWNSMLMSETTIMEQVSANPTASAKWLLFND